MKVDFCCKCSHLATRSIVPVQFSWPENPGQRMTTDTRSGKNAGSKHSQPNGNYCGLFVSNCHIAARITHNTHCLTAHSSRDSHVGILPFNKLSQTSHHSRRETLHRKPGRSCNSSVPDGIQANEKSCVHEEWRRDTVRPSLTDTQSCAGCCPHSRSQLPVHARHNTPDTSLPITLLLLSAGGHSRFSHRKSVLAIFGHKMMGCHAWLQLNAFLGFVPEFALTDRAAVPRS